MTDYFSWLSKLRNLFFALLRRWLKTVDIKAIAVSNKNISWITTAARVCCKSSAAFNILVAVAAVVA